MRPTWLFPPAFLAVLLTGWSSGSVARGEDAIDFNRDIRPILFGKCVTCHGPDEEERAAGLRLDTAAGAHEDLGGYAAVVPGDPEASEIMLRVTSEDPGMRMPPPESGEGLTEAELERLRRWIRQGGDYAQHWSYRVPVRPELPEVADTSWPVNAIDHFTLAKMESAGLQPSPRADRYALARRLALDLTGLPPTWPQAQAFVRDESDDAYETYVDSLLSNPAFGERWARVWLDLARYADSAGYADDPPRTIWAYRDYVIRSLNENVPFDQFTIEQVAGDLLPDPGEEQLIATAFHRNTLTNNEGGTNDEEFRNVAVVDRVNTTMAVWMGTTMACAQCHTHKYDPITQEEYFKFFAFFNSTADADRRDESPVMPVWSEAQKERKRELHARIEQLQAEINAPSPAVDRQRERWLQRLSTPPQWQPATLGSLDAKRTLSASGDGWIRSDQGDQNERDTYRLEIPTAESAITGLKLETSSDQQRNFVVSNVRASWVPESATPVDARYIRVTLPGDKHLHLAEIQAYRGDDNVATEGTARQSSTYRNAVASRVNDGNTDGDYSQGSVQHTGGGTHPWVEIDLGQEVPLDRLVLWNRTDGGKRIQQRLAGFQVALLDEQREVVWDRTPEGTAPRKAEFSLSGRRAVPFAAAAADFEQQGFPADSVITAKPDPERGWAIAPQVGRPHELVLAFHQPIPAAAGKLVVEIAQQSKHPRHLLDVFRLSTTSAPQLTEWTRLPAAVREIVRRPRAEWSQPQRTRIEEHFRGIAPALQPRRRELTRLRQQLEQMKPMTTVPVMRALPEDQRRVTKVQIRGNYQNTAQTVTAGTPEVFHDLESEDAPTRLDLARWLVDPDNPLTARVIANRHWEQLFGVGIVETSEEFGAQGELPSHPALLDWLAVELRESGWDLKHLIKLIVMSATYRQSSATTPEAVAADPDNRRLARGPRFRISAEMVRDQALFVGGLLSTKQFGPPVKPPQPELGLKAAFGSATDWKTSQGEDRYRRGIYTTWRRSSPYPSMAQFDAPNREVCTVRRIRTNTPLQALVTLNDPVYVEAAQGLARRMIGHADSPASRLQFAFQTALIRPPSEAEVERLAKLAEEARAHYRARPEAAQTMATEPIGPLPESADAAEYAAWTVVANVILNLDEMLMKR